MDCFNHYCPFRNNTTSAFNRCECIACPNRCDDSQTYTSKNTLIADELARLRSNTDSDTNYGIGNGC